MLRWLVLANRPFGISLGLFILVNLALALKEPELSANRVWLDLPLSEPWLSFFVLVLGCVLMAPHAWSERVWFRRVQGGVLVGFLLLALADVVGFYHKLEHAKIDSYLEFPLSLVIVLVLFVESVRVLGWKPLSMRVPKPARLFFGTLLVGAASFVLLLAHIYTYGLTDYRDAVEAEGLEAAVILGAKVYADGRLSRALEDRMLTGIDLYKNQYARYLILSGGVDANGQSEPEAMVRFAVERGVRRDHLIIDDEGNNTYLSAQNLKDRGYTNLLVVSQYFHNARVKLIFERSGISCYTVPANPGRRFERESFFLFREAMAYPYYLFFHH